MRSTVVMPCFNEERRLDVDRIRGFLGRGDARLLFVDDGSSDATPEILSRLAREHPSAARFFPLERNSGKAEAVRRGFLAAFEERPEAIGFWDADLATPLEEIAVFEQKLFSNDELAMVIGSRVKMMGRNIERRASRHYVGRGGATAISAVLGLAVYDTQCGAKLFRNNDDLRQVFAQPFLSKWIFDVEIIARYQARYRTSGRDVSKAIYELPLDQWHDVEGSKVRTRDFLRAGRDLWRIYRTYR